MITLKIIANGLVVAAAKAATKEIKALSNAVTKNKAQRRTLQVQLDAAFQNAMGEDIYIARNALLMFNNRSYNSDPSLVEKEIIAISANYSDDAFPSAVAYESEIADLVAMYKEQLALAVEKDSELVLSTIEDAVGGPDKVWVGTTSPYNNVRSVVEIMSTTDLSKADKEFPAAQLFLAHDDNEAFRKSIKDGERHPHVHCSFYKLVKTGEFVLATDTKLKGSKELVQGYNVEYNSHGGFRRW